MVRAVAFERFGGADELHSIDIPSRPTPPGFVKIRVHAAAVNPVDVAFRSGRFGPLPGLRPPYIPGVEVAGVILEDRSGADELLGRAVMATTSPFSADGGGYAEEVVVPAAWVAPAPEGLSFAEAATLPVNGPIAYAALDYLGLRPGQTIAVTGAAGIVGGYVVQLARSRGLIVIADAADRDVPIVRDLGASIVVGRGVDVARRIREHVPDGVDGLVDAAAQGSGVVTAAVKDRGVIAFVHPDTTVERQIDSTYLTMNSNELAWKRLIADVEAGVLRPRIADVIASGDAALAHRRQEAGGVRGRLVLSFV